MVLIGKVGKVLFIFTCKSTRDCSFFIFILQEVTVVAELYERQGEQRRITEYAAENNHL
jgi:hypothetical protein